MAIRPFNIEPKKIQVSKVRVKKRNKNDMRKVTTQKTYLQYRITLPQNFVDTHKLSKSRQIYLITGDIGIFTANENSLAKAMLLLPELSKIVRDTEIPLTEDQIKIILHRFPEISNFVRN